MTAPIPLYQLSVFHQPRSIMVVAKGYFDDSQTTGNLWSLGGWMGGFHHWEAFEAEWPLALANHGVPYFHMREMAKPNGVFAKWHPPEEHEAERASFFLDLAKVIGRSGLTAFSCLVRLHDLERFNRDYGQKLQPYPLAAYGCMRIVGEDYLGNEAELIFDHVEKVQSKLATAQLYADTDSHYGPDGVYDKLVITALPNGITSKEIPALQAADFWAWESRKNHLHMDEWWLLKDRPQGWGDERWEHMSRWVEEKYGSFEDVTRKSLQELLRRSNFKCLVLDYQGLREIHQARSGVWA